MCDACDANDLHNFFRLNFSDTEIEVFCARYDVDGNFEFSFEEVRLAIDDDTEEVGKPGSNADQLDPGANPVLALNLLMFER